MNTLLPLKDDPAVILVTGSRNWTNSEQITAALKEAATLLKEKHNYSSFRLVHGACRTGADAMADLDARGMGWEVTLYPADWSQGRKAGPLRNKLMVQMAKPHMALAFRLNQSAGTTSCINCIKTYANTLDSRLVSPVRIYDQ